MIRARIFRDGPGVWSFAVLDPAGDPMVIGHGDTWEQARNGAVKELHLFDKGSRHEPVPPLVSAAAAERSWLARLLLGGGAARNQGDY